MFEQNSPTKENIKYCRECGGVNPKSAKHCSKCGQEF